MRHGRDLVFSSFKKDSVHVIDVNRRDLFLKEKGLRNLFSLTKNKISAGVTVQWINTEALQIQ